MDHTERLEIELPADLVEYVHTRAGQGSLRTSSDVVTEAVRALQKRDMMEDTLRRMIAEADADPSPPLSEGDVDAYFHAKWTARGEGA